MTLIILEGNECVYKTTVAEKLRKAIGYEVKKGSSFEMSMGTNQELYDAFNRMTYWENTIVDRFVYSNRVYASLYPKYTLLEDDQYIDIQEKIKDKSLVVYLYADVDVLKERMSVRGDEYIKEDGLEDINIFYSDIMGSAVAKQVLYIDTGNKTSDEVVQDILHDLSQFKKE